MSVTFTLDGRSVEAADDETIWQVAAREGVAIPHLCYSPAPGYRADGNCRACMVEIDGERTLAASCIRKPTDGMTVHSANERAATAQRGVIELLVADPPPRAQAYDKASLFWRMAA
ncbi:MAG: (2Fe-2S)-binding protein, partial [Alphaproteobacteria bacterium]|nr:(2Fe-2S)-binding protein [Alphaproteobacteria bacterium]